MAPNHLSQDFYDNYFYSINPIAERIGKDVDATRDAYQSLWRELTAEEQNKILEESIISPETVLKYAKYKKSDVSYIATSDFSVAIILELSILGNIEQMSFYHSFSCFKLFILYFYLILLYYFNSTNQKNVSLILE